MTSYGNDSRYYAVSDSPGALAGERRLSKGARQLEALFEARDPDLERRVVRAYRQWNTILREQLRTETGLRLTVGDDHRAVPVKIVPGLPQRLDDLVSEIDDPNVWEVILARPLLEETAEGLAFVEAHFDVMTLMAGRADNPPTLDDARQTRLLLQQLLKILTEQEFFKQLREIEEDMLGAYFFRRGEVRLYWLAIGLIDSLLKVSPEILTVVVLAHELTHAYSHLGRDIDGNRWDTAAMAAADLNVVEGLAQFYTQVICKERLKFRLPAAAEAFDELTKIQQGPYLVHEGWSHGGQPAGEAVRFTLISTRLKGIRSYEEFFDGLQEARERVGLSRLDIAKQTGGGNERAS